MNPKTGGTTLMRCALLGIVLTASAGGHLYASTSVAQAGATSGRLAPAQPKTAQFRGASASSEARHVAEWAVRSGDPQGQPFLVIDKVQARLFAFDTAGRLIRATPVLLGMGKGDTFAPGVIDMDMYQTQPWQRVTPAGRFVADEDLNSAGERVLWVDYDTGIAVHKLSARKTAQRRHERLASPTPADNRVTFGCINVSPGFYDDVIARHFRSNGGIVYVLPEERPARALFGSHEAGSRLASESVSPPATSKQPK